MSHHIYVHSLGMPEQLSRQFGVKYTAGLIYADGLSPDGVVEPEDTYPRPEEWQRKALQNFFGQVLVFRDQDQELDQPLKSWLYADAVRRNLSADLYLAAVNDEVGHGVFAMSTIQPGELIGEYTGLVRPKVWGEKGNPYLFEISFAVTVDAQDCGNFTRFINHSSENANAHPTYVIVDGAWHILLIATKTIAPGAQVLFNYGPRYWRDRAHPQELT